MTRGDSSDEVIYRLSDLAPLAALCYLGIMKNVGFPNLKFSTLIVHCSCLKFYVDFS